MASFLGLVHSAAQTFNYRNRSKTLKPLASRIANMVFVNAPNKVPEYQRTYQQAYKAHTRLWQIGSRSRVLMTPYVVLLWGTFGATIYAAGRKTLGYNTYFGKE